jgi:uncharacterized membrane protein YciS (DUF1049 family)
VSQIHLYLALVAFFAAGFSAGCLLVLKHWCKSETARIQAEADLRECRHQLARATSLAAQFSPRFGNRVGQAK